MIQITACTPSNSIIAFVNCNVATGLYIKGVPRIFILNSVACEGA